MDNRASHSAASLAFYFVLAVSPLFLFLAALSSVLLQSQGAANALQQQILDTVRHSLGARQATMFQGFIEGSSSRSTGYVATIGGLTVSLYGASGLFLQLRETVNRMWGDKPKPGIKAYFIQRAISILMVLVISAVIVGWVGVDAWLRIVRISLREDTPYGVRQAVSFVLAFAFWTPVYGAVYKWLAPSPIPWRTVWAGAVFTSLSYAVTKYLLTLYFAYAGSSAGYGPGAAIVVLLLWLYYSAQIFLFGVELTRASGKNKEV